MATTQPNSTHLIHYDCGSCKLVSEEIRIPRRPLVGDISPDPRTMSYDQVGMDIYTDAFSFILLGIGIIVSTASLLSLVLSKIRQPKVIAEVLGGILLGE